MPRLSPIARAGFELIATATLAVDTAGEGFVDITAEVSAFAAQTGAGDGLLFLFMRQIGRAHV